MVSPLRNQKLVDDRFEVQLLRRDQRKAVSEIESHLVAEDRLRARAGPVGLFDTLVEDAGDSRTGVFRSGVGRTAFDRSWSTQRRQPTIITVRRRNRLGCIRGASGGRAPTPAPATRRTAAQSPSSVYRTCARRSRRADNDFLTDSYAGKVNPILPRFLA